MDRVERFVHTACAKVSVFDTKDYKLEGIREEFRGMLSPIVMRTILDAFPHIWSTSTAIRCQSAAITAGWIINLGGIKNENK